MGLVLAAWRAASGRGDRDLKGSPSLEKRVRVEYTLQTMDFHPWVAFASGGSILDCSFRDRVRM